MIRQNVAIKLSFTHIQEFVNEEFAHMRDGDIALVSY